MDVQKAYGNFIIFFPPARDPKKRENTTRVKDFGGSAAEARLR